MAYERYEYLHKIYECVITSFERRDSNLYGPTKEEIAKCENNVKGFINEYARLGYRLISVKKESKCGYRVCSSYYDFFFQKTKMQRSFWISDDE